MLGTDRALGCSRVGPAKTISGQDSSKVIFHLFCGLQVDRSGWCHRCGYKVPVDQLTPHQELAASSRKIWSRVEERDIKRRLWEKRQRGQIVRSSKQGNLPF